MLSPCKDCRERKPHCHGSCDQYAAFRAACNAANARRRAELDSLDTIITSKRRMAKATASNPKGR